MNNMAAVEDLKIQYGNKTAVNGISFEVREGEVLGLLGPNGAGKSTTTRVIRSIVGQFWQRDNTGPQCEKRVKGNEERHRNCTSRYRDLRGNFR
ncbi:MDR ABC transporter ATPase [Bacillus tequilensis]|nr:MDR ABC transporter ATPase [Bacillus tequilensis]